MRHHQPAVRSSGRRPDDSEDKSRRARDNSAFVRRLLSERQPEFAEALAAAERDLRSQETGLAERLACPLCGKDALPLRRTMRTPGCLLPRSSLALPGFS